MKAREHGPDELYEKFHVYKSKSRHHRIFPNRNEYYEADRLGVDGEFIFVLRPETNDKAAIEALLTYARVCEGSYPELSAQIVSRLSMHRAAIESLMMAGASEDEAYRKLRERG